MRVRLYILLSIIVGTSFFLFTSCQNNIVLHDEDIEKCEIAGFSTVLLNNTGIVPKETKSSAVAKEAFMLELRFDKQFGDNKSSSLTSYSKLGDELIEMRIVDKHFVKGDKVETDVTDSFKIKDSELPTLSHFETAIFPSAPIRLRMLHYPEQGMHQFEITLIFNSGRELKQTILVDII